MAYCVNTLPCTWHNVVKPMRTPGGALDLHFGRYVPRRSEKYGARERLEREDDGLWSGREREKVGLWSGLQRVELVVSGAALSPERPRRQNPARRAG